jgi:hypothetical protein
MVLFSMVDVKRYFVMVQVRALVRGARVLSFFVRHRTAYAIGTRINEWVKAVSYGLCVVRVIKLQYTSNGQIQKQFLYLFTLNPHRSLINELTAVRQGNLLTRSLD